MTKNQTIKYTNLKPYDASGATRVIIVNTPMGDIVYTIQIINTSYYFD